MLRIGDKMTQEEKDERVEEIMNNVNVFWLCLLKFLNDQVNDLGKLLLYSVQVKISKLTFLENQLIVDFASSSLIMKCFIKRRIIY
jgi:hypothetical protein